MQYTEKELTALIANVEKEFTAHLAKAEETFLAKSEDVSALVKAEDAPAPEKKDEKAEEKKPEHKEEPKQEEKKPEEKEAAPAAESKEEPKADAKDAPPEAKENAPAAEGSDNQEGHDYDEQDLAHMHDMYSSMSRGELKAHHDSVKRALDAQGAAQQAAPAAAPAGEMHMSKSEEVKSVEVKPEVIVATSKETEMLKSELEAQKAKTDGLQKSLDAVSAFLTKLVEKKAAPAAKAITSLDVIAKSEGAQEEKTLTKAEIDSALNKASMDTKLAKSDRDAINAYYLNGASINTISHLLK